MIALLLIALTGAGVASADPAPVYDLKPTEPRSFSLIKGQPQWGRQDVDRLGRTVFRFSTDGQFAMIQPDGYPSPIGAYGADGTVHATASRSVGNTGSTTVELYGQLHRDGDALVLDFRLRLRRLDGGRGEWPVFRPVLRPLLQGFGGARAPVRNLPKMVARSAARTPRTTGPLHSVSQTVGHSRAVANRVSRA